MASGIPAVPASFKSLQHHIKTAAEHDSRDPVVAYYCKYTFCHYVTGSVVRYPRYVDTYRRYLREDTSIAEVTIYRGIL